MFRIITLLMILSGLVILPNIVFAKSNPNDSVRTANYFLLSGTALEDSSTINTLSKFDLIIIPAEAQEYNRPFFSQIRKLNPDIIILAYVPSISWNDGYWNDPLHQKLLQGIKSDWWLRDASQNQKSIWPETRALNLNSGWSNYLANFVKTDILSTGLWDGVFYDEVMDTIDWIRPLDTDRNFVDDTKALANTNWRNGYKQLFQTTRVLAGEETIIITNGSSNSSFSPWVNGRMFETFPSKGNSLAYWQSQANQYLRLPNEVRNQTVLILNVNSENTGINNDYQKVRFGITTTLLGDGYFSFDHGTQSHNQLWYYDEYDAVLGEAKSKPTALNGGEVTQVGEDVYFREFAEGKIVVNATGEVAEIELDGDFEKIRGTRENQVNNGAIVREVTLQSQDGLILLRPLKEIDRAAFTNGSFARIFSEDGVAKRNGFFAYDQTQRGGTQVVRQDIDFDNQLELVVADETFVTIYDESENQTAKFAPFTENYKGGVNLAIGDIEGDGSVEIVVAADKFGPQLRIYNKDGNLIHPGFFAYDKNFRGGVNIAIGDLNGDGYQEIVTGAGELGGPHVRVFNKDGQVINPGFFAYEENFRGGVTLGVGDVNQDGIDEIVTIPASHKAPLARIFDKDGNMFNEFYLFDKTSTDPVDITVADLDADGRYEIIGLTKNVFTTTNF